MLNYDLSELTVLVAEDSGAMTDILRGVLMALGIRNIVEVNNGLEAFNHLKEHDDIDLVIADNMMEPMSGIELISLIRSGAEGVDPYAPFIMISGFTDMQRILEARDAGISEYLAKPVSARQIYQRISSVIENPRDFVRTHNFFGPDRRRRELEFDGPDRRKNEYSYN